MARKAKSNTEETTESAAEVTIKPQAEEAVVELPTEATLKNTSNCGGVLKDTREAQGLTIHDISSQLRLSNKQVEAIEADQFELLPEPTIVRGFIRNYAKLLKIDAQPLLAAYSEIAPDTSPKSFAVKSNANSNVVIGESKTGFSPATFITLLIVFSIIGGLFYYYSQNIQVKTPEAITNLASEISPESDIANTPIEFALPPAERTLDSSDQSLTASDSNLAVATDDATVTPIELPSPSSSASNTPSTNNSASTVATEASASSAPPAVASQIEAAPITNEAQAGLAKLHITANEESWINVIDASGKEVYSQILPAGSSRTIQAKPTLNVTIGNASATILTMNGKTIDLVPFTRDKVAHIKLD
jgi:cytoskeleton protein RodZ